MKAFKIKKRSHRQPIFIKGESITSLPKPKIPKFFFKKIHPPFLFKREIGLPIFVVAPEIPEQLSPIPEPSVEIVEKSVEKQDFSHFEKIEIL